MHIYSEEELEQLPEFEDLKQALKKPLKVVRFRAYRQEDASSVARIAEFANLQALSISLSDVSLLLPQLHRLPHLRDLHLQACKISQFPKEILSLSHLRSLYIGNSSLSEVPDEIGNLIKLESLGFAQNTLQSIPDSIGTLSGLKVLSLSYNQLSEVPASICNLANLEDLFLDVNDISQLPEALGNLRSLQTLNLNHNELRTLPDSIAHLHHLRNLSLENNPFDSFPSSLGSMHWITDLSIESRKRSLFMDWSYPHSDLPPCLALEDLNLCVLPKSPTYPHLIAAIEEAGLSSHSSAILEAARDSIRIESTEPDDYSQLGASRLGGFPDLPNPALFPRTDNLYWIFLAQFDLTELAPLNSYLPRSGLLSFFLDSTESLNARVLWHRGATSALSTVRHSGADELTSPDDDYTQKPHRVIFTRSFSLPHSPPPALNHDDLFEAYENSKELHKGIDHQINGYTYTQHESPQEQAADKLRGQPGEWVPLLKLGWDGNVGFCFWDAVP